jgi:hypothetical protein
MGFLRSIKLSKGFLCAKVLDEDIDVMNIHLGGLVIANGVGG